MEPNEIVRLDEECAQVTERVEKLAEFVQNNPEFIRLDAVRKHLLVIQLNAMSAYQSVLSLRLGVERMETSEGAGDADLDEPLGERTCSHEEGCESCQ